MGLGDTYLAGMRSSAEAGQELVSAYERGREWKERLKEKEATHVKEQAALDLAASHYKDTTERLGRLDTAAATRATKVNALYDEEIASVKAGKGRWGAVGGAPAMKPFEKVKAIALNTKNYLAAAAAKDQNGMTMYGSALKELGADIPKQEQELSWGQKLGNLFGRGSPAPDAVSANDELLDRHGIPPEGE